MLLQNIYLWVTVRVDRKHMLKNLEKTKEMKRRDMDTLTANDLCQMGDSDVKFYTTLNE